MGVSGSTGASKSSVINALMDEETLARTNCIHKTKEMLKDFTAPALLAERLTADILGTTKFINQRTPGAFHPKLQQYMDSKEKVTGDDKDWRKRKRWHASLIEYWPLIEVRGSTPKLMPCLLVQLLLTCLVWVDSNASRAAVAQNYMKHCTRLSIVVLITRAIDAKAAKTFLGDTFEFQLKFDGGLSTMTLYAQKRMTSVMEAVQSLELPDEFSLLSF
ncbi:hypothetical protein CC78DRAFT_540455 [Lojkania enalia]|uniref:Uncharacterized protein n=1 Tax=Lojkania enalia TaxID=147567 RepID=A0A9P4TPS2_9PLEO|nr:hypothetical protein CC78DRAFT_540455 [Didymosphaeria enalia]